MDYDSNLTSDVNLYDDSSADIIGVPNAQAEFWEMQEFADNCEPTSESFIIRQFGFDEISTNDFAYISQANGWYSPGSGTSPDCIGEMMDLFGIENHTIENATIEQLAHEIASGHGVIVGVKSDQLWDQGPLQDLFNWAAKQFGFDNPVDSPADHALCVTGFDVSDPDNPMVIVNDPGHPEGQGAAYPLNEFMNAWENSNFLMTATDDPLPSFTAFSIRDNISQYLADNGIQTTGPMLAETADGFGDGINDMTEPVVSIIEAISHVICAVAGAVLAVDCLQDAMNSEDFAYYI